MRKKTFFFPEGNLSIRERERVGTTGCRRQGTAVHGAQGSSGGAHEVERRGVARRTGFESSLLAAIFCRW